MSFDFDKYTEQEFFKQFFLSLKEEHQEYLELKAAQEGLTSMSVPVYEAAIIEAESRIKKMLGEQPKVKPKVNKSLKWKYTDDNTSLYFGDVRVAVVDYARDGGWYWYSLAVSLHMNTLNTKLTFDSMEQAQQHCLETISATIANKASKQ